MKAIVSCGVDIIEIERIKRIYGTYGSRFLNRVCSRREESHISGRRDQATALAGRFAAKEAVLKALGSGLYSGLTLPGIEIHSKKTGEPYCVLNGQALKRANSLRITEVFVSISHCKQYAVAQAVAVREE